MQQPETHLFYHILLADIVYEVGGDVDALAISLFKVSEEVTVALFAVAHRA